MTKSAKPASTKRKRPRRYLRSRITRNLILETAQEVFLSDGYSKTTIAKISEMANVGYGTVYSHFKGKDDILSKVIDNVLEDFYALLNIEFAPTTVEEAKKIFHNIMLTAFKLSEQHRPIMKVYQQALGQSETIAEHWQGSKTTLPRMPRCRSSMHRKRLANSLTRLSVLRPTYYWSTALSGKWSTSGEGRGAPKRRPHRHGLPGIIC